MSTTARTHVSAVSLALLLPVQVALGQLRPEAIAKQVTPAVAQVMAVDSDDKLLQRGSGFVIESGELFITNAHVVRGAHRVDVLFPDGRKRVAAAVLAYEPRLDLAILAVHQKGWPSLKLASDRERPEVGAPVYVVGNPLGLSGSFSNGLVSGWRLRGGQELLQISAPISPGSSGGPVVAASGHVIGVATASLTEGQNLNFAVSVHDVRALLGALGRGEAPSDVASDVTAADSAHYERLISDYASVGAYPKAVEAAAQAIAKYPRSAQFYLLKAQNERRAGQLDSALKSLRQGLAIDPKAPGANLLLAQIDIDTGKLDEAISAVRSDVTSDTTNKERDAQFLLGLGANAYKAGVALKQREQFEVAIRLLKASDEINPTPQAKFFGAVSAWQLLAPSLQQSKHWNCADVRSADALLAIVTTSMPGGSSVSLEAAGQIMSAAPQARQYIEAQSKRLCK